MTSNGRTLYVVLEGAVAGPDPDPAASRRVYEFDVRSRSFTAQLDPYRVDVDGHFVADAQALDRNRLLIIERDGAAAAVRKVYEVDLRKVGDDGYLRQDAGRRPGRDPRPERRVAAADQHRRRRSR